METLKKADEDPVLLKFSLGGRWVNADHDIMLSVMKENGAQRLPNRPRYLLMKLNPTCLGFWPFLCLFLKSPYSHDLIWVALTSWGLLSDRQGHRQGVVLFLGPGGTWTTALGLRT